MNIIDLAYCVFYRHDEKHDIGFPVVGAPVSVTIFMAMYIESIFFVLWEFKVIPFPQPELEKWHFLVVLTLMCLAVASRFWGKEKRARRLQQYEDYKKAHPKLYLWRFWIFVSLAVVMFSTPLLLFNTIYER